MRIVGIDNGLSGGIVLVEDLKLIRKEPMPVVKIKKNKGYKTEYDTAKIYTLFMELKPDYIYLEKAQPMPGQGQSSKVAFSMGLGYGLIRGICVSANLSVHLVHPKTWQKEMFRDMAKQDTKTSSFLVCQRTWPQESWSKGPRTTKFHDGLCDAAVIALYGFRQIGVVNDEKQGTPEIRSNQDKSQHNWVFARK